MSWSKATFRSAEERVGTIELARASVGRAPGGVGVFKSREGLDLYLSPVATEALRPEFATALAVVECARPDELAVEVVVGPYDDPAWYDQAADDLQDQLDMMDAEDLALLQPDADIEEIIAQSFAA